MRSAARHMFAMLTALACAATALSAQSGTKARNTSDRILFEELQGSRANNLYDLVESLRPQWLRINEHQTVRTKKVETTMTAHGRTATVEVIDEPEIIVYVNNTRLGTRESLRELPVVAVTSLEFVSPTKATLRWGGGHIHGAIIVHTTEEPER